MKYFYTAVLLIIGTQLFSQNKKCSNYTLSLELNTKDTVLVKVKAAYQSVMPTAASTIWASNKISLVKKSSTVNSNIPGTYQECFVAQDGDGLSIECCRTVIVYDNVVKAHLSEFYAEHDILIKPNPVKHGKFEVVINSTLFNGLATFRIIDVSGKEVFYETREVAGSCEFTLPAIIPGVYFMRVSHEGKDVFTKMVFL